MQRLLIKSFSLSTNLRTLFYRFSDRDAALDGIRAISILMLVFFHAANITALNYQGGPQAYIDTLPRSLMWLLQADKGVDIFFVLSGFLIGRMLIQEHARTGTLQIGRFYVRRFLRLFPAYAVLLAMVAAAPIPQDKWYLLANLFYVNNYLSLENMIAPWTWSLAVEEQFYLLLPPLLMLFYFNSRHKILWLCALILAAPVIRYFLLLRVPDAMSSPYITLATHAEFLESLYDNLHTRYDALVIGVLAAHLYLTKHKMNEVLSTQPMVGSVLVFVCISGMLAILNLPIDRMHEYWSHDEILHFHVWHRPIFALLTAGLMLGVLHGRGLATAVRNVLSSRILLPFGQLAYSIYLFHIPFIAIIHTIIKTNLNHGSTQFDPGQLLLLAGVGLIPSTIFAGIVYLAVEKPVMNLRDYTVPQNLNKKAPSLSGGTVSQLDQS